MEYLDSVGYLIITFNYNVTAIGKVWLTLMLLLRMAMVLFAGYPLYQDEQERFICNTLQPGCSNVCYDIFSPVSHMRFWLFQTMIVFLPYAMFAVHILHRVVGYMAPTNDHFRKSNTPTYHGVGLQMEIPDFSLAYIVQLLLRTLLEAGFCTGQYFLFGILVPKRFSCSQAPCTSSVDCYISRPTEKSLMMIFIWGTGVISLILGLVDLIYVIHRRRRSERLKRELLLLENDSLKGGCCSDSPPNSNLHGAPEPMALYADSASNDLEKIEEKIKGDSHSLPSYEGETASFQTESSHHDVGKSNMNTNSNKSCSWQVSLTSADGKPTKSDHHLVIPRQLKPKQENCSSSNLGILSPPEKSPASKSKKSEWV
ncbi:gap junction delta-4 protein [Xenopus tropicalis]|uniref:Gap junction protein n=1 Tax=Xenopus tropicalis TaxID=8364 RepID=Q6P649_XENTR|eukprot:NP_989084.1 gap junction delta-4 protein [Xenopus tropicalis]